MTAKTSSIAASSARRDWPVADVAPAVPTLRISAAWALPNVMRELGLDVERTLRESGLAADLFEDRENRITYPQLERLFLTCEKLADCDYFGMLVGQHSRLVDMGLAGRAALCQPTAGDGLRSLIDHFNLHDTAGTISAVDDGSSVRFVYAIAEHGLADTRHFQYGGMVISCNFLHDLFGPDWSPTVVKFASRSPSNIRPFQAAFNAPLEFDAEESAVVFAPHWLARPLPPVDPVLRASIEDDVRRQRAELLVDLPVTLRRILRKRLVVDAFSMDDVAAQLSMHRRTLDRRLQRCGTTYGALLESVREDIARQLLRDTNLPIQRVAESVRFSSAANFATAFRRRAGMTPTEYRRRAS